MYQKRRSENLTDKGILDINEFCLLTCASYERGETTANCNERKGIKGNKQRYKEILMKL